jgi:pimeloyl-ACP methyl ester carboxylesterase
VQASLPLHGIDVFHVDRGQGPALALLHETATSARVWEPLTAALGDGVRTVAHDRRGWGETGAPEGYAGTTVEEHSEDAAGLLEALGIEEAVVCGAGLGAVAALDLTLRRGSLVRAAVLVEPPLLALLPSATEGISADRESIEDAIRDGGPRAAVDLYLAGGLPFLGSGAERLPGDAAAAARDRPLSLFAELAAVPAWSIRRSDLLAAEAPALIVTAASTPPLLRDAAGELSACLGSPRTAELGGSGLPHVAAAPELAREIRDLMAG